MTGTGLSSRSSDQPVHPDHVGARPGPPGLRPSPWGRRRPLWLRPRLKAPARDAVRRSDNARCRPTVAVAGDNGCGIGQGQGEHKASDTGTMDEIAPEAEFTADGVLGGRLRLRQPRRGYRAGLDAALLAAACDAAAGRAGDRGRVRRRARRCWPRRRGGRARGSSASSAIRRPWRWRRRTSRPTAWRIASRRWRGDVAAGFPRPGPGAVRRGDGQPALLRRPRGAARARARARRRLSGRRGPGGLGRLPAQGGARGRDDHC